MLVLLSPGEHAAEYCFLFLRKWMDGTGSRGEGILRALIDGVVDLLFKPTKAMPFWTSSAVGANAGPALTAVTGLFWFVEPGNLYPGGPVG